MLDDADRQRYARHLLLPEIGERGQAALCATRVPRRAPSSSRAGLVAQEYLQRAGVQLADAGAGVPLPLPGTSAQACLAGQPLLEEAAAQLAGAFAAVELIKGVVGAGTPSSLPAELCLEPEDLP